MNTAAGVVTKDELARAVWPDVPTGDEAVAKCISEVRRALGDEAKSIIKTVPRRGYLMDAPVSVSEAMTGFESMKSAPAFGGRATVLAVRHDHRPSIAVLAFVNLSGDPQQEYISDGITEDIIVELSRFSGLMVIARNSTFQYEARSVDVRQVGSELGVRYVLEGSVQLADDRVRISAQLVDAMTGAHRWAERYDRTLVGVFEIQNEVARAIAATIAAHVNDAEIEQSLSKPPAIWQAYDYYMRSANGLKALLSSFDVQQLLRVRHLLDKSIALDPDYGRAYGLLSHTYVIAWTQPIDDDYLNPAALARAHDMALQGLRLAPRMPEAHAHLGSVLTCRRQHDAALGEFEKAIELNPNFSDWRLASVLTYSGQLERAIESIRCHMRLDPFCPPWAHYWSGLSFYLLEQYPRAVTAFARLHRSYAKLQKQSQRAGRGLRTIGTSRGSQVRGGGGASDLTPNTRSAETNVRGFLSDTRNMQSICLMASAELGCPRDDTAVARATIQAAHAYGMALREFALPPSIRHVSS